MNCLNSRHTLLVWKLNYTNGDAAKGTEGKSPTMIRWCKKNKKKKGLLTLWLYCTLCVLQILLLNCLITASSKFTLLHMSSCITFLWLAWFWGLRQTQTLQKREKKTEKGSKSSIHVSYAITPLSQKKLLFTSEHHE